MSEQKGHLTKKQQTKRQTEQELVKTDNKYFLVPPAWLTDEAAVKEYKRLVNAMKNMDMLGDLDANNLAGYCNAYANYLKVSQQLSEEPFTIDGNFTSSVQKLSSFRRSALTGKGSLGLFATKMIVRFS